MVKYQVLANELFIAPVMIMEVQISFSYMSTETNDKWDTNIMT